MRALSLISGAALSTAVLTACDGGVTEPPFLPDTSPTPEARGFEGFREFAELIDEAVARRDGSILEERAQLPTVPLGLGDVAGDLSPQETREFFEEFVSEAWVDQSDGYGSGEATLYAVAQRAGTVGGEKWYEAIVSKIALTGTRQILVYDFALRNGRWRAVASAIDPHMSLGARKERPDQLTGKCTECYDYWERWEGTP